MAGRCARRACQHSAVPVALRMTAVLLVGLIGFGPLGYAKPPEEKERGPDQRQEAAQQAAEARAEQAEQRATHAAEVATRRVEQATVQIEQRTAQAEQRAEQAIQRAEVRAAQAAEQVQRAVEQRSAAAAARSEQLAGRADAHQEHSLRSGTNREQRSREDRQTDRIQLAQAHVRDTVQALHALEHARWSHNPHDTRGQGNMGKVDMRDPYGFDKESGREKSERARPVHEVEETPAEAPPAEPPPVEEPLVVEEPPVAEPSLSTESGTSTLNLEALVTDLQVVDAYLLELQWLLGIYQQVVQNYPQYADYYTAQIAALEYQIAHYAETSAASSDIMKFGFAQEDTLQYSLTLGTQEGYAGTTLQVTTSFITTQDYNSSTWSYDYATGTWQQTLVPHAAGDVIFEQTQEVTLSADGSSTVYSYVSDVPWDVLDSDQGDGGTFQLAVTVTDPVSGTSYTTTYDRLYYMYHCPYGIVYDQQTGQPVAGATVTVHALDGSIVPLDKAANPNASNPQTTDATGRYNCKLAIGKQYYLSVKAPGYAEYKSQVFSERWSIVREDVALTRATAEPSLTSLPPVMGELLAPVASPAGTAGAMRRIP